MPMRLGYLYSRYPVISQTFCDAEMLALERRGVDLEIASVSPPCVSRRHGHRANLRAEVDYAPSPRVGRTMAQLARRDGIWPAALVAEHEARYGPAFKAERRARNGLFFAEQFVRSGVAHFHVHFASHATHTALFIKEITKIGFSFTAHAQDFMLDVGSDELLREMCREAAFVVTVSDYSRELLVHKCPDAAGKIYRIYNGIDLRKFERHFTDSYSRSYGQRAADSLDATRCRSGNRPRWRERATRRSKRCRGACQGARVAVTRSATANATRCGRPAQR